MTVRVHLQPSFLLHRRPFRDSSQLLEVFCLEHGRLSLVARGTARRRRGGALTSLLQPFRPLLLSFSSRGELGTLTAVEAAGDLAVPSGERLFSALYINELLSRLLHRHEAHAALFSGYGRTLEELAGAAPLAATLRRFELELLEALGYAVDLTRDAQAGLPLDETGIYRIDPQLGPCRVDAVCEGDGDLFPGAALLAIADGEVGGAQAAYAKRLTRLLLAEQLGGEPLRSRQLFARSQAVAQGVGS